MTATASHVTTPAGKRRRVVYIPVLNVEEVLIGVAEFARFKGWELNANLRFHRLFTSTNVSGLLDGIDGVIVNCMVKPVQDWLAAYPSIPVVHAGYSEVPFSGPSVEQDAAEAGRLSARHLMEAGHSNFALYMFAEEVEGLSERFKTELNSCGFEVWDLCARSNPPLVRGVLQRQARIEWLIQQLRKLPLPIGIGTPDDTFASELIEACLAAGLKVPADVAVVGCDNREVEKWLSPVPISSVDVNHRVIGRTAAAVLNDLMDGKPAPTQPILIPPVGVVVRQSSATYVCNSPKITEVMQYLRQHFHEPLRVEQLARIAGLSLRSMQMEFKKHVGHTVADEMKRLRLERAKQLLWETDLKLDAVAMESGFKTGRYLSEAFVIAYGVRPSAWRESTRLPGG